MNKFFTLIFYFFLSLSTKGQYVNIDPVLKQALLNNVGTKIILCFNDLGQLDTTCSSIPQVTEIYLSFHHPYLTNLDGIQYFKSLRILNIEGNPKITSLPKLND